VVAAPVVMVVVPVVVGSRPATRPEGVASGPVNFKSGMAVSIPPGLAIFDAGGGRDGKLRCGALVCVARRGCHAVGGPWVDAGLVWSG
jgi:hypothetical protein